MWRIRTNLQKCQHSTLTQRKIGLYFDGVGGRGYCVSNHDQGMRWNNYGKYFNKDTVRIATCYPELDSSLGTAAKELTEYIILREIKGNILLVGSGYGGLLMYKVGTMLPKNFDIKVTVMTVAAPFGEAVNPNNNLFVSKLKPLPAERNHIAFVVPEKYTVKNGLSRLFKKPEESKAESRPGIQEEWPYIGQKQREPELCLSVDVSHRKALEDVLADFGKYASGETFFSLLEDFVNTEVNKHIEDT